MQFKSVKSTLYRKRRNKISNQLPILQLISKTKISKRPTAPDYMMIIRSSTTIVFRMRSLPTAYFHRKNQSALSKKKIPREEREILMDSTFKVVPESPFTQVLVIYARLQNKVSSFDESLFYPIFLFISRYTI